MDEYASLFIHSLMDVWLLPIFFFVTTNATAEHLVHPVCIGVRVSLRYIFTMKLLNQYLWASLSLLAITRLFPKTIRLVCTALSLYVKILVALQLLQHLTLFNLFCQSSEYKIVYHCGFICIYLITIKVECIFIYLSDTYSFSFVHFGVELIFVFS